MEMMEVHMARVLIPLVGLLMTSTVALAVPRAEGHAAAPALSAFGEANALVEQVRSVCVRRRVCGPHGRCAWRTVCRRIPSRSVPQMMGPGMM
jgi:hypothetical protein